MIPINDCLEKLFVSIPEVFAAPVYWKNVSGIILGCNEFFLALVDKPKQEIIGTAEANYLHALDDLRWLSNLSNEAIISNRQIEVRGHLIINETKKIECLVKNIPIEINITESPIILCVLTDIDTYEARNELLITHPTILKEIIINLPGYVYWKNTFSQYMGCNSALAKELNLNSPEDIISKTDYDFFWSKEDADIFVQSDIEVMSKKIKLITENKIPSIISVDGYRHVRTEKTPLFHGDQVIGVLAIAIDITAEKEAEKLKLEKELDERKKNDLKIMSGAIAHELRTPLAAVKHGLQGIDSLFPKLLSGYNNALDNNLIDKPIRKDKLKIMQVILPNIYGQIDKANLIIDLMLKNISDEKINIEDFSPLSILDVLDHAIQNYPFSANEAMLIKKNDEIKDFIFHGDFDLVKLIIWNIIKNSIYFIHAVQKGQIFFYTRVKENFNELHIKDTAKGMHPDEAKHIFDSFYTNRSGGTGIGLSFCKIIMEAHGGDVSCVSVENEYADFILKFPKYEH